ncbi:solute carrier family 43 member 3-like [Sphaeramia orbicularis]|uniref:solute carrier family 43 member 3-like n=1 Tax=Sphaeramia orbicularis TaxID=375764 RepID=UPI00117D2F6E|nr:solute carrier family 43 member 3-like [Sphaeramia orbicularis]
MACLDKCLPVRCWLTFVTGLVECLCFAGIVFGWASLVFVLKMEGYFSSFCQNITEVNITEVNVTEVNITDVNVTGVNGTDVLDCGEQDGQFSLIFTIASVLLNLLTFSSGLVFDWFGTTVARLCGIFLHTTGILMVGFSTPALSVLLFPALCLIGVGGGLFLITNMQVGNLFGARRSTVITLYNGAFDSSAALFLVIKLLHEVHVSFHISFHFLSACSVIHLLRTLFLMPRNFIPYPLPEHYTYGLICGNSNTPNSEQTDRNNEAQNTVNETPPDRTDTESQALSEKSFRECLLSRCFIFHVLWLSVMMLRHNLFIGTLNPMLQRLTGEEHSLVSHYTTVFAITQLCGLLFAPWNGLIMDRHKGKPRSAGETEYEADLRAMVLSLFLTALQCLLFSVCATIPILPLQYMTFILQVLNRSFLYGGHAAFISIAFPVCHFGKLFGLVIALAGLFSLLQYPCFILVEDVLDGDPLYVNIALTLLILFAFIHPFSVYLHCRSLASQEASGHAIAA